MLDIFQTERCLAAAEVPADHFDVHARVEDDAGGFGIDPYIELCGRGDVALATGITAHDDAALYGLCKAWFAGERESDVGERAECNDFDSRIGANGINNSVHRVRGFRSAFDGGIAVLSEAVFTVEPVGDREFAKERRGGASKNRNFRVADFSRVERVVRGLRDRNIPGDDGYRCYANFFRTKRHDQGYGVVGSGVGVDEEGARHLG